MALIDTYKNNLIRKQTEKNKLINVKVKESNKISQQNQKIISAKKTLLRITSSSTQKSKLSEIQRAEAEINNIHKKIVSIDKKIAQKEHEILLESNKIKKEEQRLLKKQIEEDTKARKERERQMKKLLNKPTNQYINNGGQMNIASENANITVTFNYYETLTPLEEIINKIKDSDLSVFNPEEQEILIDNINVLQEQLTSEKPKKGFIRTAISGLTGLIYTSATLIEPLEKLINFAKPYIE
ncbi:MAG: hypothetical protein ACRC5T_09215 [Cetobacterium sp.]